MDRQIDGEIDRWRDRYIYINRQLDMQENG